MKTEMNIDLAIRYLTGKVADNEKRQFEYWLNGSETNFAQFSEFKKYWELSGIAFQNYNPNNSKGWENVSSKTILKIKTRTLPYRFLKIAASILIIISLGIAGKIIYNWSQVEEIATIVSANNIISVVLSDSSKVWLNASSELKVPKVFKGNKRNVWLKGEAFFEVAKNPNKPFKVYAHGTTTQVVGTSFNIRALDSAREVLLTVVTGKVWFSSDNNKSKKLILSPGQKGLCDILDGQLQMGNNRNVNFLAWKTRKLQFNNASLDDVCEALREYYYINITPGIYARSQKYSFTGNINNASLREALSIIELTLGIKFEKNGITYSAK